MLMLPSTLQPEPLPTCGPLLLAYPLLRKQSKCDSVLRLIPAKHTATRLEQAKVDAWFAQFDVNHSGVLEREQLSKLLEHLTGTSPDRVTMEFLMQKAIAIDTTGDGKPDTSGISRASAEAVVAKYAHYVEQKEVLQSIFTDFDTNHSGRLERGQLRALLLKVSPGKEVADSDVDYVLNMCNDDSKGSIARDELLPAVATWRHLAESSDACDSSSCVIC
ncbi:hypothetical protein AB1Y20_015451 [Prymnesium parvum]|uniref:EF-hand domain-containing protein n=1 Tax=Prymnesium parvum TaxID=97485 RepID=A0AB34JXX8_PRYPA